MAVFKRKHEVWQTRLGTSTLDPLQVLTMQGAIRKKKSEVVIDGRKYLLSYKIPGQVFYKPEGAFSPAGYLDIEKFLKEL